MDSIDRYDIHEEIGQGGMSVVYRGQDTTLQREVAVKVLHQHLAKRDASRQRFQREARAVARLDHDNIIDVYDFSDEDADHCYIVMEYIPGQNLREFVDSHTSPPPEIVALIGAAIADALEHAHDHGVIHRDLKPENIMVTDDGRLTLMDFGIAHVADAETMTQTGSLLGSPAHLAPEIIDGKSVNEQSDVFSLGTVLYYLSTGTFPFRGDNPSHLLREIVEGNFDEPAAVEPTMSCRLNDVIVECLQRDPAERPGSVSELRNRLLDGIETLDLERPRDEELRSYFNDPETYTQEFEDAVVPRLVQLGDRCAEDGQTAEAFHYYNRVLAYDPTNDEVTEALDELHASQRSPYRKAAGLGVGLGMLAGVFAILFFSGSSPSTQVFDEAAARSEASIQSAAAHASTVAAARSVARARLAQGQRRITDLLARRVGFQTLNQARELRQSEDRGQRPATEVASAAIAPDPETAEDLPSGAKGGAEQPAPPAGAPVLADARSGARPSVDAGVQPPPTFTYSFRILPLAANVYIDGERYSVPKVHRGVALRSGEHHIRVESKGCRTYESSFYVDGPAQETRRIVLEWRDAFVRVESDVPAVVYVDGERSSPVRIGAHGEDARIRIPFGKADAAGSQTRRQVALEVRARDNMQQVRRQTVTVRPGASTSLTVNFRN